MLNALRHLRLKRIFNASNFLAAIYAQHLATSEVKAPTGSLGMGTYTFMFNALRHPRLKHENKE